VIMVSKGAGTFFSGGASRSSSCVSRTQTSKAKHRRHIYHLPVRRAHKQAKQSTEGIYIIFLCVAHTNRSKAKHRRHIYISSSCALRTQTSKAKHRRHIYHLTVRRAHKQAKQSTGGISTSKHRGQINKTTNKQAQRANQQNNKQASTEGKST